MVVWVWCGLLLLGSSVATPVLYCPTGFCVAPKLGVPSDYAGSYESKYDCFNKVTEEIQLVTALDPTLSNFDALSTQLTSSGYSNQPCKGLPTNSNCNGRGTFSFEKRRCVCSAGYAGPECSEVSCSTHNCNNHGYCVNGVCYCYRGFTGSQCELSQCPELCNGNGKCVNGQCVCYSGFTGPSCSTSTCPNECSFQGECQNNVCVCDAKYTGPDCSIEKCPNDCFESIGRGFCVNGTCACASSWVGESCQLAQCPNKCSGHGECDTSFGECKCSAGYTGLDCSQSTCLNDCGDHGRCVGSSCVCDAGYAGSNCLPACKFNCSGAGVCSALGSSFVCFCNKGRTGEFCETKTCPADCSGHGSCDSNADKCVCEVGFMGVDCSIPMCHTLDASEGLCSGNGYCMDEGVCQCADGWKGAKCSHRACSNGCSNHGYCDADINCVCDAGWGGKDCSIKTCPKDCSGHGRCVTEPPTNQPKCICDSMYGGVDCSQQLCPANCSGNGDCIKGVCYCRDNFVGLDCGQKPCGSCSGHGTCGNDNNCVCENGWVGKACQTQTCPGYPQLECTGRGLCINGSCVCAPGFFGADCAGSCPTAFGASSGVLCSGRGRCLQNRCACDPAWTGTDCNQKTCPSQCNGRGFCNNGTCICALPYTGEECEEEPGDGVTACDCSMNCTVLCLRQCSGVHDRYGMFQGHQCYLRCAQYCVAGCATNGKPSLDFVPDIQYQDLKTMVRADHTVTPEELVPPLETVDGNLGTSSLVQDVVAVAPSLDESQPQTPVLVTME